jgi:hypothetical protein
VEGPPLGLIVAVVNLALDGFLVFVTWQLGGVWLVVGAVGVGMGLSAAGYDLCLSLSQIVLLDDRVKIKNGVVKRFVPFDEISDLVWREHEASFRSPFPLRLLRGRDYTSVHLLSAAREPIEVLALRSMPPTTQSMIVAKREATARAELDRLRRELGCRLAP